MRIYCKRSKKRKENFDSEYIRGNWYDGDAVYWIDDANIPLVKIIDSTGRSTSFLLEYDDIIEDIYRIKFGSSISILEVYPMFSNYFMTEEQHRDKIINDLI